MTMSTPSEPSQPQWLRIVSWLLRIGLALAFAGSGLFKLSGRPAVIDEFAHVGLGQWLRYVTAALELSGAVLLVWPKTVAIGAMTLGAICVGALLAQVFRLHIGIIHVFVLGSLLAAVLWIHREQLGLGAAGQARRRPTSR